MPICGSDGKNYSSPCNAKQAGITTFVKGSCSTVPCAGVVIAPVCDAVKKTYPNKCLAEIRGGVAPFAKGSCVSICPAVYKPVCGADGKTYPNECEATVAGVSSTHCTIKDPVATNSTPTATTTNPLAQPTNNSDIAFPTSVSPTSVSTPTAPTTEPSAQATIGDGIYSSASYNEASFSLLSLLLLLV
jgi:hypothetical protein